MSKAGQYVSELLQFLRLSEQRRLVGPRSHFNTHADQVLGSPSPRHLVENISAV